MSTNANIPPLRIWTSNLAEPMVMGNTNPKKGWSLRMMMRETNVTSSLWFPDSCVLATGSTQISYRFSLYPTLCKVLSLSSIFYICLLSLIFIPLFIKSDAFCFLNFSHTLTQYYCLISSPYHLLEFCNASYLVLFLLVSYPFSMVPIIIQMKCPPFQLISVSAFDILPIPIDLLLHYSLSHPQLQLALQT